jgi:O-antigen/teichoic acid export membrane protein
VRLALGERWTDAIVPMQVIALAVPVRMLGTIIATTRLSMGRVDLSMSTALAGFLIAPVAFMVAAPYGPVGLAITWALMTPVHVMLSAIGSRSALGTRWSTLARAAWPSMAAAVVMLAGVELARSATPSWPDAVRLPALVTLGAALYVAASVLVNRAAMLEAWRLFRLRRGATP